MKVGSLFSGYGGLDLALDRVFETEMAWYAEVDKAPVAILEHHWPGVSNLGDVTGVDWKTVPAVDVLLAGYPCQPFSTAGQRKGTTDERHLWPHVLNAISVIRPRFAIFENVRGHITLGLREVLEDLASIGWNAEWTVNRASDVGAPHHRERLFILAYPDGERFEAKRFPRRSTQKITWDNDLYSTLAGLSSAANFYDEMKSRWGDRAPLMIVWAMLTGHDIPPIIEDHISRGAHPRFPEIRSSTNPEFVEWMMGLPTGWVTAVDGLTRNQKIKALGNGVVPHQGAAAIRQLLERISQ